MTKAGADFRAGKYYHTQEGVKNSANSIYLQQTADNDTENVKNSPTSLQQTADNDTENVKNTPNPEVTVGELRQLSDQLSKALATR